MSKFTLTKDHIELLRHAYVGWSGAEFGAPEINPKRPYGNSDVIGDIAELLSWTPPHEDDRDYEEAYALLCERAEALHQETATALQIVLVTGEFTPGEYVQTHRYDDRSWVRVA